MKIALIALMFTLFTFADEGTQICRLEVGKITKDIRAINTLCQSSKKPLIQVVCFQHSEMMFRRNQAMKAAFLCRKAKDHRQPVLCVKKLKHLFNDIELLKICAGSTNYKKEVKCVRNNLRKKMSKARAIDTCFKRKYPGVK